MSFGSYSNKKEVQKLLPGRFSSFEKRVIRNLSSGVGRFFNSRYIKILLSSLINTLESNWPWWREQMIYNIQPSWTLEKVSSMNRQNSIVQSNL